jgi:putative hydrolase of the HAD superfamily
MDLARFFYFDLGKVIVNFDVEQMYRQMAAVADVDQERVVSALNDDGLQRRYELGQLSDHQFYEAFCEAIGRRPDCDALTAAGNEIFELNASIIPVIAQLYRSGFRLGILSNTCQSHWEYCRNHYWIVRELFSVYALSYRIGAAKPEARIFQAAAELADVPPQEIFYLDDIPGHVAGARAIGIDAVQYTTTSALVSELRRRGLKFNY